MRANSSKTRLAEWLRDIALNVAPTRQKIADPKLIRQLRGIGNNLNQIAHYANTWKSEADTRVVAEALFVIWQTLEDIEKNVD